MEEKETINKGASIEANNEVVNTVLDMLDMQKEKNIPIQSRKNCITVLGSDPMLSGKIKYNTLSCRKNVCGALPWNKTEERREWTNIDDEYLIYYMETYYFLNSEKKILSALEMIADTNKFNPFIDMLNSVQWDRIRRLENILPDYMGAVKCDYTTKCIETLMLGVISRAFSPGTKFDYSVVLIGPQGIGKSTFFQKLCCNDEWYLENIKSLYNDKEAAEKIQGKLIVEFNEMLGLGNTEIAKSFLTQLADDYRAPYQKRVEKRKRTCVFVATTNKNDFLTDKTGNRRYLPIECCAEPIKKSLFCDDKALKAEFLQVWAEVYEIYKSGKFSLVLPKDVEEYAKNLRDDFEIDDPMVGAIQTWLDDYADDYVCNVIIAKGLFESDSGNKKLISEIAEIMRTKIKGWERNGTHNFGNGVGRQKCYTRIADFRKTEKSPFGVTGVT